MCIRTKEPPSAVLIDRIFRRASIGLCCFQFASKPYLRHDLPEEPGCWMNQISHTQWIVERAKSIGFDRCGVVRAEKFPELAQTSEWLALGYGGEMKYLADPRRTDRQNAL